MASPHLPGHGRTRPCGTGATSVTVTSRPIGTVVFCMPSLATRYMITVTPFYVIPVCVNLQYRIWHAAVTLVWVRSVRSKQIQDSFCPDSRDAGVSLVLCPVSNLQQPSVCTLPFVYTSKRKSPAACCCCDVPCDALMQSIISSSPLWTQDSVY